MTVAVGHIDGWMVADTLSLQHNDRFTTSKIVEFDDALVAAAGDGLFKQIIKTKIGERPCLEGLLDYLRNENSSRAHIIDVNVLYVGKCKDVYMIDSYGQVFVPKQKYWAIGSGADLVMGFLFGLRQHGLVEPKDAVESDTVGIDDMQYDQPDEYHGHAAAASCDPLAGVLQR